MIDYANKEDLKEIYGIWKSIFAFDDRGYTDFFFKHDFDLENTLVLKDEKQIKAIATFSQHQYMLHHRLLKASMIYGVATLEPYRNQGCMNQLMTAIDAILSRQELMTFIQAYNPDLYKRYGYEVIYYRKRFELTQKNVPSYSTKGCTKEFSAIDLLKVYGRFASRFNGFMVRDEAYFANYMEEVKAQNGYIVAVKDRKNITNGYACIYDRGDHIEIDELVYLDIKSLLKLVNLALKLKGNLILHVSSGEQLERIFENAKKECYGYTLVKIHNYELFNRLYESNVRSIKEAFNLIDKPLMMIESH